jgi:hypothetical protein
MSICFLGHFLNISIISTLSRPQFHSMNLLLKADNVSGHFFPCPRLGVIFAPSLAAATRTSYVFLTLVGDKAFSCSSRPPLRGVLAHFFYFLLDLGVCVDGSGTGCTAFPAGLGLSVTGAWTRERACALTPGVCDLILPTGGEHDDINTSITMHCEGSSAFSCCVASTQ